MICIEFIKMLCKHTPDTLVEVLMFAIARQMIVEHTTPLGESAWHSWPSLILFAIRKFLFADSLTMWIEPSFLPSQKIADINQLIHVGIPEEFQGRDPGGLNGRICGKGENGDFR